MISDYRPRRFVRRGLRGGIMEDDSFGTPGLGCLFMLIGCTALVILVLWLLLEVL